MNERIYELSGKASKDINFFPVENIEQWHQFTEKFAELIMRDMHRKVIASILITDVIMEEKGLVPTSEDYIRAINKDFGVEE